MKAAVIFETGKPPVYGEFNEPVALESRARLVQGETVLVNGATGSAGTMAVQIAKYLGARKVIATGRNQQSLNALLAVGADEVVVLQEGGNQTESPFRKLFEQGVDIVLDYLWGPSATLLMEAASARRSTAPIHFVQNGTASDPNIILPGVLLRSSTIEIMGRGIGNVTLGSIMGVMCKLMQAAPVAGLRIATKPLPLHRVAESWSMEDRTPRIVFTMSS